jgi:hypothetical protein
MSHYTLEQVNAACSDYIKRVRALEAALLASNQWLVSALTCKGIHWDAGQVAAATKAYETARALLALPIDGDEKHG